MTNFNVQYTKQARQMGPLFFHVGTVIMDNLPSHIKCLEVISSQATGAEDSLYFSDLKVSLLFMITKEEYDWMANNPGKIDSLVLELMAKLPKDRLMTGQYVGLADNKRLTFQPQGKCETMDNEKIKYAFFQIPYGLKEWEKVEKCWVMYNARLQSPLPGIDMNEAVNVFLDINVGKQEIERFAPDFKLMEMTGKQLLEILPVYYRMGVPKIVCRSTNGNRIVKLSELLNTQDKISGASLQLNIIRFLQTIRSVHINEENYKKTANLWWTKLCNNVLEDVFIVPFNFEGEGYPKEVSDRFIHVFPNTKIEEIRFSTNNELIIVRNGEEKVIAGTRGLSYTEKADDRQMSIRTSYNPTLKQEWLGVFTDLYEFDKVWKNAAHIGIASFADFAQHYKPAKGIVINPANECFFLEEETISQLAKHIK